MFALEQAQPGSVVSSVPDDAELPPQPVEAGWQLDGAVARRLDPSGRLPVGIPDRSLLYSGPLWQSLDSVLDNRVSFSVVKNRYRPRDEQSKPVSGPGFSVDVPNVFGDRTLLNFFSEFSGTRFVQGRRVLLDANYEW